MLLQNTQEPQINSYSIFSPEGMEVEILNLGASIRSIKLPEKCGKINIALGYANIEDYRKDSFYLGSSVGRFANRIAKGAFSLEGKIIQLPINSAGHHLHGGPEGFSKRFWEILDHTKTSLELGLFSPDGDQGYPGNLQVKAVFKVESGMKLSIEYSAVTDKPTPVNLTSHVYLNLNGFHKHQDADALVDNHMVQIRADCFTPVDEATIPTGEIASVSDTAFDLRVADNLGSRLGRKDQQLEYGAGFDHNYVVGGEEGQFRFLGEVSSQRSGVRMKAYSDQPGVQFYTGNHLGSPFTPRSAMCLETQNFPDAPNQPGFPDSILEPDDTYLARTMFEFDVGAEKTQ